MTPDEKRIALGILSPINVRGSLTSESVESPIQWSASPSALIEIGGDGFLTSVEGRGATPAEAVADLWRQWVDELPALEYLVVSRNATRRNMRWNGEGWRTLNR